MATEFTKAKPGDYDEVIDLANLVFSMDSRPHDFPAMLPKAYKKEHFMDGIHYLAKEDGRIRAVVGAYPLKMHVLGEVLDMRGVGMVSVHPYARSRGYMKALMHLAVGDMKKEGVALSCLGGQRQRYEYFGYTPAGTGVAFEVRRANIRHKLGRDYNTPVRLERIAPDSTGALDYIYGKYADRPGYIERDRGRLFDILSSWRFTPYAVTEGERITGYLVADAEGSVCEIGMDDMSRLPEALGELLGLHGKTGERDRVEIVVPPHHTDTLRALESFAESCTLGDCYQYNIFDYEAVLRAFCGLRCRLGKASDGSVVLGIGDERPLRVSVRDNAPSVEAAEGAPALRLARPEAARLFFSPVISGFDPVIADNPFLQSLLPLPLFAGPVDGV